MPAFAVERLDYDLPQRLIAQEPLRERGGSRLLIVNRDRGEILDRMFSDFPAMLRAGDALVINDTRVVPARISAVRRTGGRIDGLFLREVELGRWIVMLRGHGRLRTGEMLTLRSRSADGPHAAMTLDESLGQGEWRVSVEPREPADVLLDRIGRTPLPPYIHRTAPEDVREPADREYYQTVFARRAGAVAAPTAGMHFTELLLASIRSAGVAVVRITLHVGAGTFMPIKAERLEEHRMHAEWYDVGPEAAAVLNDRRRAGGRIVAVGTTCVRVLESSCGADGAIRPGTGWTDLFCYPPYRFRAVDALLTNFHLPRSTLLALVMAFAGVELIRRAYRRAVEREYRFYSYGDAMFLL